MKRGPITRASQNIVPLAAHDGDRTADIGCHFELRSPNDGDERFELPLPETCKGEQWFIRSTGTRNLLLGVKDRPGTIAAIPAPGGAMLLVSTGDGWLTFRGELC